MSQNIPRNHSVIIPRRIVLYAIASDRSIEIRAQCVNKKAVLDAIALFFETRGGNVIYEWINHPSCAVFLTAYLQNFPTSELLRLRSEIQCAGGILETVRENFHIKQPTPPRPPACEGCRYYYGKVHGQDPLICAMHPYGPTTEECPDRLLSP